MNASLKTTTTTSAVDDAGASALAEALKARGVLADLTGKRLSVEEADRIRGWIAWWDSQPSAQQGVLVNGIRSGEQAPSIHEDDSGQAAHNRRYSRQVIELLGQHLPGCFNLSDRVAKALASAYGQNSSELVARRADSRWPHPAAFVAVTHIHSRGEKLTKRHLAEIREAMTAFDDREIEAIKRDTEIGQGRSEVAS